MITPMAEVESEKWSALHSRRARGVEWLSVSEKFQTQPWARSIVDSIDEAFNRFVTEYPDHPPTKISDWTHFYFCDDDAAPLIFDVTSPQRHVCSKCGRVYSGEPWNGAWRTKVHNTFVHTMERAAILAHLRSDPSRYVEFIRKTLLFYAEHYAQYPVHGEHSGKGKIMPQCLDEAIFLVSVGQFIRWGEGQQWFSENEMEMLREKLISPMVELLKPQISRIHNIHVWMGAALASAAGVLNDSALLEWAIENDFGWHAQLERGVNDDGFWWEGSIAYHHYTFRAFGSFAQAAAEMGVDLFDSPRLVKMLQAPVALACDDGQLPAHNDCWPNQRLQASLLEFGAWAWPEAKFETDLSQLYKQSPTPTCPAWNGKDDAYSARSGSHARNSINALLFGPATIPNLTPRSQTDRLFKSSGMAILHSGPVRLCIRSGKHGGWHDHLDRLNVDLFADGQWLSPDLGTSGYGAEITMKWHKTPASHNIVVVNEKPQTPSDGRVEQLREGEFLARADHAYPGVKLSRHLKVLDTGWSDRTDCASESDAQFDWFFHAIGTLQISIPQEPTPSLGTGAGYAWPRDIRKGATSDAWTARWTTSRGTLELSFDGVPDTEVFTAHAEGIDQPIQLIMVRRKSRQTTFAAKFQYTSIALR